MALSDEAKRRLALSLASATAGAEVATAIDASGAAGISIADEAELYTAENLEEALAEVKSQSDENSSRVAANVPLIDTPTGDAETTVNAVINALVAAGLMVPPN